MNILMVSALDIWSLADGKGAPSLYRTLRAYGEAGHTIYFVAPTVGANHFAAAPSKETPAPPEIPNVNVVRFPVPSIRRLPLPWPGFVLRADQKLRFALAFPWLASRRGGSILREHQIDLLYGYEVHGVLALRRLRRRWKIPAVARFQGTVMHPHLGNRLALLRRYEEVRALQTPADLYVMTDDGTRGDEVLGRLNPSSEGRVRFWRNGLDRERFTPASMEEAKAARDSLGIDSDRFVLLTACVLLPWKRVDRAVRALAEIRRDVPEALLLVLGEGEERENLERLAGDLGVAEAVRFEGAVPQQDVARYLHSADVFLSLNDLSNVGNPLLEAMACAKAIVTTDSGDTGKLICDGKAGILLSDADPQAVARAVVRLAREPELREEVASGAASYAAANFWTWEERLKAEIEEVQKLVAFGRGASK